VLVGQEQDLLAVLECPCHAALGIAGCADRAAVLAGEGLYGGRGIHVGDGDGDIGDSRAFQVAPALLDLTDLGHVGHGATRCHVRQDHLLVVAGEDVGALGHEVHSAEHDEFRFRASGGLLGQLERVAGDVGELDDFIALVMVTEDEEPITESRLGGSGTLD
jgi:hypothetical protein